MTSLQSLCCFHVVFNEKLNCVMLLLIKLLLLGYGNRTTIGHRMFCSLTQFDIYIIIIEDGLSTVLIMFCDLMHNDYFVEKLLNITQ